MRTARFSLDHRTRSNASQRRAPGTQGRGRDDLDDPCRHRPQSDSGPLAVAQKQVNKLVSRERAANKHGFAPLENWRSLTKVRMNARHATTLLRIRLVLTNAESRR